MVFKRYTFTFCWSLAAPDSILSLSKAVVTTEYACVMLCKHVRSAVV